MNITNETILTPMQIKALAATMVRKTSGGNKKRFTKEQKKKVRKTAAASRKQNRS